MSDLHIKVLDVSSRRVYIKKCNANKAFTNSLGQTIMYRIAGKGVMDFAEIANHSSGGEAPRMVICRAFRTRPFRRTQTEVRNSDSDSGSDLRNRDFPAP
jgi:hypothetical protein